MTIKCLLICHLISLSFAMGQGHYPLSSGNRWDYYSKNLGPPVFLFSLHVYGDTLMNDGHVYAVIKSELSNPILTQLLRQDGSRVYQWTPTGTSVLCDFTALNADTIDISIVRVDSNKYDTVYTIVEITDFEVFGDSRRSWICNRVSSANPTQILSQAVYSDSIGYVAGVGMPGSIADQYCIGAIINGRRLGILTSIADGRPPISSFSLLPNYPNPFNGYTIIPYSLDSRGYITLLLTDCLGRIVHVIQTGVQESGYHTVLCDAQLLSSGVYHYQLLVDRSTMSRSMLLLK